MNLRHLVIEGEKWSYSIGRGAAVLVAPNGHKSVVFLKTLTGRDPDLIDRGRRKKTSDGMIMPAEIKRYIRGHAAELRLPKPPPLGRRHRAALVQSSDKGGVQAGEIVSRVLDTLIERGLVVKRGQWVYATREGQSILRRVGSPRACA
jgi:hypothetical protein